MSGFMPLSAAAMQWAHAQLKERTKDNEDIYSVATEDMSSVATEDMSSVATE